MSGLTLYSFSESGNSYKVRLFAALLGLELKIEELDFLVRILTCGLKRAVLITS